MKVEYRRDFHVNYMILSRDEQTESLDFRTHMLTGNRIPGLLTCRINVMDGRLLFSYDITSRQMLKDHIGQKPVQMTFMRLLLRSLIETLEGLQEYLLEADGLLLDPAMIYLNAEQDEMKFCYYPYAEGDFNQQLQVLFEALLPKLDQKDHEAVMLGYRLYSKAMSDLLTMERLKEILKSAYGEPRKYEKNEGFRKREENEDLEDLDPDQEGRYVGLSKLEQQIEDGAIFQIETEPDRKERAGSILLLLATFFPALTFAGFYLMDMLYVGIMVAVLLGTIEGILSLIVYILQKRKEGRRKKGIQQEIGGTQKTGLKQEKEIKKGKERKRPRGRKRENNMDQADHDFLFEEIPGEEEPYGENMNARKVWRNDEREERGMHKSADGLLTDSFEREGPERESVYRNDIEGEDLDADEPMTTLLRMDTGGKEQEKAAFLKPEPIGSSGSQKQHETLRLEGKFYLVGKSKKVADLVISGTAVSRLHAKIFCKDGNWYLTDLNSRNGTFVNEEMLQPQEGKRLNNGDRICFADQRFLFTG